MYSLNSHESFLSFNTLPVTGFTPLHVTGFFLSAVFIMTQKQVVINVD